MPHNVLFSNKELEIVKQVYKINIETISIDIDIDIDIDK